MRKLVVFGGRPEPRPAPWSAAATVVVDQVPFQVAVLDEAPPFFNPNDPKNARAVLTRTKAFSLNYRDKAQIFKTACKAPPDTYYVVGSEFAGEVVAIGPSVTRFSVGDRVMGNNAYPDSGSNDVVPGVPSNHLSKELQILHELKLAKMPDEMKYEVGAAFSIGAQTNYSMVRRLSIHDGANVLVTSAKSNTSLFAIAALRSCNVNVYATSTSNAFESKVKALGAKELVVIGLSDHFHAHPVLANVIAQSHGFDFVIDPYFDLNFSRALDVMKIGAKYISCGVYDQYLDLIGKARPEIAHTGDSFVRMMLKNISAIGNCIGTDDDLARASTDYASGRLEVVVDSVFTGGDAVGFMDRTFNASDRFGKVVYRYD